MTEDDAPTPAAADRAAAAPVAAGLPDGTDPDAARVLAAFVARDELCAATAEVLMRSRFAAYAAQSEAARAGDETGAATWTRYLWRTWCPWTRPTLEELTVDAGSAPRWRRLTVLDAVLRRADAEVEFVALYVDPEGRRGRLHERSRFRRAAAGEADAGAWLYVDGAVAP